MSTKTITSNLPSIDIEGSLSSYLTQIKKFPMLSAEEEYMLAKSWRDRGDLKICTKINYKSLEIGCKNCNGIQRIRVTSKRNSF